MRVKNHYSCEIKKNLIRFLEKNEIPYEIFGNGCYFDIYEDQEAYRKFRKKFFVASLLPFKSTEYSQQEIENAEWLTVRSKSSKVILGE